MHSLLPALSYTHKGVLCRGFLTNTYQHTQPPRSLPPFHTYSPINHVAFTAISQPTNQLTTPRRIDLSSSFPHAHGDTITITILSHLV